MKEIVFATNNQHKLQEIKSLLSHKYRIIDLNELGFKGDIPEEQDTLQGNASQKSHYIYNRFQVNCFADDTGLEVDALNGAPGVYSARYAGVGCTFDDNVRKMLTAMDNATNRKAHFRTVISLILEGTEYFFEGRVDGKILTERIGTDGFGYDPIFQPNGLDVSFAQMTIEQKNEISHRGKAIKQLAEFLENY